MESCVLIDGIVLWVIVIILLGLVLIALFSSVGYAVSQNENEILRYEKKRLADSNKKLRDELSHLQEKVYGDNFVKNLSALEVD